MTLDNSTTQLSQFPSITKRERLRSRAQSFWNSQTFSELARCAPSLASSLELSWERWLRAAYAQRFNALETGQALEHALRADLSAREALHAEALRALGELAEHFQQLAHAALQRWRETGETRWTIERAKLSAHALELRAELQRLEVHAAQRHALERAAPMPSALPLRLAGESRQTARCAAVKLGALSVQESRAALGAQLPTLRSSGTPVNLPQRARVWDTIGGQGRTQRSSALDYFSDLVSALASASLGTQHPELEQEGAPVRKLAGTALERQAERHAELHALEVQHLEALHALCAAAERTQRAADALRWTMRPDSQLSGARLEAASTLRWARGVLLGFTRQVQRTMRAELRTPACTPSAELQRLHALQHEALSALETARQLARQFAKRRAQRAAKLKRQRAKR